MSKNILFTKEQQEILDIHEGIHLVLAPPGSGKTELLAARVEKAINDGYTENDLICLTFTNRAAKGMKDRIESKFPNNNIIIGNIHHFCSQFLFANQLLPQYTALLDEEDADQILEEAKSEFDYPRKQEDRFGKLEKPYVYNPEILKLNNYIKQKELNFPDEILIEPAINEIPQIDLAQQVCKKYEQLKKEYDLLDFDDILTLSYQFLKEKKSNYTICSFKWIQVDEVQDLNPLQWEILRLIASEGCLSVYFGDYEQAIFSFMGAKLQSLHKIEKECKGNLKNGIHNLQTNFRSPSYLLKLYVDYAQALLHPVWKKPPVANIIEEVKPDFLRLFKINGEIKDEASFISGKILPYLMQDQSKTAIIVRNNATADIISSNLTMKGIEHFKISGFDLFRRKSIKGLMSFLSTLNNEFDRISWVRIFSIFGGIKTLKESRKFVNDLIKIGLLPTDILTGKESSLIDFHNKVSGDRIIVFDTETTGLDTLSDDIIQISAFEIIDGIPGNSFDIYIKTDKDLTESQTIHNISRDFLDANGVDANKALTSFINFLGDNPVLAAHNLEYDFDILRSNLARYTKRELKDIISRDFDTLKISKLIYPGLHSYKLKDLLKYLNIEGVNSHNAKDDVEATVHLIKRMETDAAKIKSRQVKFAADNNNVLNKFKNNFRELYDYSRSNFEANVSLEAIINYYFNYVTNMSVIDGDELTSSEKNEIDKLVKHVSKQADIQTMSTLKARINKYVPEYKGYKESDLITGEEQIYLSTVYKAKGLEFDNVIVAETVKDVYPSWASKTNEKVEEDARALYVALSRAKKRLYITSHNKSINKFGKTFIRVPSPFLTSIEHHFKTT